MLQSTKRGSAKIHRRSFDRDLAILRQSALLNPVWYRQYHADLRQFPIDAARHYLEHGAREGRNPHPLFDTLFYLETNIDVAALGKNPFVHFLEFGAAEGRNPHPLFDTKYYARINRLSLDVNALEHFWLQGPGSSAQPHPLFDTPWYLSAYPDIAHSAHIPLLHYLNHGADEGRDPSAIFSTTWYRQKYRGKLKAGLNPLVHYATEGWRRGFCPSPGYDVAAYLEANPDVVSAGVEPLTHYLTCGRSEGRQFPPTLEWRYGKLVEQFTATSEALAARQEELESLRRETRLDRDLLLEAARSLRLRNEEFDQLLRAAENANAALPDHFVANKGEMSRDLELLRGSSFFDSKWYLDRYADVAAAGLDPVDHYTRFGANEGRDPGPRFSSSAYLASRKDVAAASLNPLIHFLRFGIAEHPGPPPAHSVEIRTDAASKRSHKTAKALFISHDANIGGAPVVLAGIARWFQDHTNYEVNIICMEGGPWVAAFEDIGRTLVVSRMSALGQDVAVKSAIRAFVGNEPAFIFVNSVASGRFLDVNPFASPVFGYVHELEKVLRLFPEASARLASQAKHVFCAGPMAARVFQEFTGAPSEKLSSRAPFIEIADEAKYLAPSDKVRLRHEMGWSPETLVVMGCGVVHWRKQPDVFVRVAAKVAATTDLDVRFVWIGGGEDIDQMRALVLDAGLVGRVEFLGHKSREEVRSLLRAADIFALTSLEDPFPLVCLEAAAESVPSVIFRDATGITAMVEPAGAPRAGMAIADFDEEAFAAAVTQLLSNADERSAMAAVGYERVLAGYTASSACKEILTRIRKVANLRPRVSVIVPNFNCGRYLDQRLSSIERQSFQDCEIILLDDKSTDGSERILEQFAAKHPETQFALAEHNSGSPFLAWERGIARASGDLLWIAEADDWCEPSFLERAIAGFATSGVRLVHGRSIPVNQVGEVAGDYEQLYLDRIAPGHWRESFTAPAAREVSLTLGRANSIPNASGVLVLRESALRAIRVARAFRLAGDWAFYLVAICGGRIAYVHEAVNYHRRHDGTVTRSLEGTRAYFQELANVGALVSSLYGEDLTRDAAFRGFLADEATRFGYAGEMPAGTTPAQLSAGLKPGVFYGIGDLSGGGAQMFALRFVNEWARRGGSVVLFSAHHEADNPATRNYLSPEVPLVSQEDVEAVGFAQFMKDWNLDVAFSGHWWGDKQIGIWMERSETKIPWVIVMHGCYENVLDNQAHFPDRRAEFARAQTYCDAFVWTAEKNKRVFEENFIQPKRTFHIVNGFRPVTPGSLTRREIGLPEDALVFTLASRAIESKGWRVALEAFEALRRRRPDADICLQLIGDGPMAEELEEASPLAGVRLVRHTSRLADYIHLSDVCLLPSWFPGESLPLVLIEFLAQGKPAIVSNIGMCAWAIDEGHRDGAAGIVVKRSGAEATVATVNLVEAMEKFLTKSDLATSLAPHALRAFSKFDFDKMIDSYKQVFDGLAGQDATIGMSA
jgi:glycosyltransferase involved in cell wall biosynthesis